MPAGRVVLNPTAINRLLRSPQGAVTRDMLVRGERVKLAARTMIHSRTGKTASSIVKRISEGVNGVQVLVGSDYPVMAYLEHGTRPHVIEPRNADVLHWVSGGGEDVFATFVSHPGTRAQHILERALQAAR